MEGSEKRKEPTSSYIVSNDGRRWNIEALNPDVPLGLNLTVRGKDGAQYACNFLIDVESKRALTLKASRILDGESRELSLDLPIEFDGRLNMSSTYFKKPESPPITDTSQPTSSLKTYGLGELEPFRNSFNAAPYALRIKELVQPDGSIPLSILNKLPGEERGRIKMTLTTLTRKESKPVTQNEKGYIVNDREAFDKIVAAAKLVKKK